MSISKVMIIGSGQMEAESRKYSLNLVLQYTLMTLKKNLAARFM